MSSSHGAAGSNHGGGDDWMHAFDSLVPSDEQRQGTPVDPSSTCIPSYPIVCQTNQQLLRQPDVAPVEGSTRQVDFLNHPASAISGVNNFQRSVSSMTDDSCSSTGSVVASSASTLAAGRASTVDVSTYAPTTVIPPAAQPNSVCPKAQERSERKRCREKKRRTDANQQFAELSALLRKIEESEEEDDECGNAKRPCLPSIYRSGQTNRIELIARTVAVLGRLHNDYRKRGKKIEELTDSLEKAKKVADDARSEAAKRVSPEKQEKVMMMVPMMVSPDALAGLPGTGGTGVGGTATVPQLPSMAIPNPIQQMQQFMSQWSQTPFSPFPLMSNGISAGSSAVNNGAQNVGSQNVGVARGHPSSSDRAQGSAETDGTSEHAMPLSPSVGDPRREENSFKESSTSGTEISQEGEESNLAHCA